MADTAKVAWSAAPDWANVPFDVGCARCGEDLRGRSEPVCPACGLEFDWAEAVPIERLTCQKCGYHLYGLKDSRCPECGTTFTWQEVLDDYHRQRKPLFEYRWRNEPIRSFVRTWFRALRPGKFWRSIDIHDPPKVRPLQVTVLITLIVLLGSLVTVQGLDRWLWYQVWTRHWRRAPGAPDLIGSFIEILREAHYAVVLRAFALWLMASLGALLLFPQSMRACKVRFRQVLRVWAYAMPTAAPLVVPLSFLCGVFIMIVMSGGYRVGIDVAATFAVVAHATWSLRCGYAHYLDMPHGLGIAVSSQVVAVLAAGICELHLAPNVGSGLFFQIADFIGLV